MRPCAGRPHLDLAGCLQAVNAFLAREGDRFAGTEMRLLAGGGAPVTAVLRADAGDLRRAKGSRLVLINPSLERRAVLAAEGLSAEAGQFLPFRDPLGSGPNFSLESPIALRPAEVRVLEGRTGRAILPPADSVRLTQAAAVDAPRLVIEAVTPMVDDGRYPVKRIVGEVLRVEADAFGEGHDPVAVALLWRAADEAQWQERRMRPLGNDRWAADMPLERLGRHLFAIEVWRDDFAIFRSELTKKHEAALVLRLELEEGRRLVVRTLEQAAGESAQRLKSIADRLAGADDSERLSVLLAPETADAMTAADPRSFRLRHAPIRSTPSAPRRASPAGTSSFPARRAAIPTGTARSTT